MKATPLCKIGYQYGTDKSPLIKHPYTPVYYDLLKRRINSVKKVLELGVWCGASLRMWRDFFPNAQIYGIDVLQECKLVKGERIKVFVGDSRDERFVKNIILNAIGTDVDLFVDDGSHWPNYQALTCKIFKPLLPKALYLIEDVRYPDKLREKLPEYKIEELPLVKKYRDDGLVIVR
jgi:23S rRNA U2552 (ribose-2'-O)-methylase RlmE/FtsJ